MQFSEQADDGSTKHVVFLIQVNDMNEFEETEMFISDKPAPISAMFVLVRSANSAEG